MEHSRGGVAVTEAGMTTCDILASGATAEAVVLDVVGDLSGRIRSGMEGMPCLNQSFAAHMTDGFPDGHACENLPASRDGERVHSLGADFYPAVTVLAGGQRGPGPSGFDEADLFWCEKILVEVPAEIRVHEEVISLYGAVQFTGECAHRFEFMNVPAEQSHGDGDRDFFRTDGFDAVDGLFEGAGDLRAALVRRGGCPVQGDIHMPDARVGELGREPLEQDTVALQGDAHPEAAGMLDERQEAREDCRFASRETDGKCLDRREFIQHLVPVLLRHIIRRIIRRAFPHAMDAAMIASVRQFQDGDGWSGKLDEFAVEHHGVGAIHAFGYPWRAIVA